jgi:hypothetical protein
VVDSVEYAPILTDKHSTQDGQLREPGPHRQSIDYPRGAQQPMPGADAGGHTYTFHILEKRREEVISALAQKSREFRRRSPGSVSRTAKRAKSLKGEKGVKGESGAGPQNDEAEKELGGNSGVGKGAPANAFFAHAGHAPGRRSALGGARLMSSHERKARR